MGITGSSESAAVDRRVTKFLQCCALRVVAVTPLWVYEVGKSHFLPWFPCVDLI